ncbi:MAG: DEAD/DEAH box helicase family protein [Ignavibacteriae bacterium]|nr:DEAD/DEAH box helicase family protein [Ignavibacteriota bacterium]
MFELVSTSNFKFLEKKLPELAILGDFAEQYVYADPSSAAVKLRLFAEKVVVIISTILNLQNDFEESNLYNIITTDEFKNSVPQTVIHYLHSIRITGNRGAHGSAVDSILILEVIKQAHQIAKWIYASYLGGNVKELSDYITPTKLDEKSFEIQKRLYDKERELFELKDQLEKIKNENIELSKSKFNSEQFKEHSQEVANELEFNEEQTRRLIIDSMISSAGWKVGANGEGTDEVKQEWPTEYVYDEGIVKGKSDYVLFDPENEKPLAVIEAKKTSADVIVGRKQAELYADGLEKKYGQRPILFYTNGYKTFIWNDRAGEPPREIFGMYSKDSLHYLIYQRNSAKQPTTISINNDITNRLYQKEAIKRVLEKFESKRRKALIVLATGTGKTRVAVSLVDVMMKSDRVKRVLFLCDRRELRKQAKNVFREFIDGAPLTILNANSANDKESRIYLATYPAMNQYFQNFDVGFFDLIIADESHRSIYKVYSELFKYFDAYQIGLTATPVNFVHRSTFTMFDCRPQDPTAHFSYEDAVTHEPPYLSKFEVFTVTTKFLREGIRYSEMSRSQQLELEDQLGEAADEIEYDSPKIDNYIFNRDTNREILRNLMDHGMKMPDGSLGKTIIFARNHRHAVLMDEVFNELYPHYGGNFCKIIDNYDPRADQLIDDFKYHNLTIAISVDMMDTGIDVPEILNLVFAKPVKSFVKFWQMIGRGTRIRKDLFGSGEDKTTFRIFDHWGNFEWFDFKYKLKDPTLTKVLTQRLFEARFDLAETALEKFDKDTFNIVADLLLKDVNTLVEIDTVSVKEKMIDLKKLQSNNVIQQFSTDTKILLQSVVAPLMQWIDVRGNSEAYKFDLLIANTQKAVLTKSGKIHDFKDDIIEQLNSLSKNINQVKEKSETIKLVTNNEFWVNPTIQSLENIRLELRSIMKFSDNVVTPQVTRPIIDVEDSDIEINKYTPIKIGTEMVKYKERVDDVLARLFSESMTLQKIKSGKPVNEKDIQELISLVLTQHPDLNLELLYEFYPETAGHLDLAIRRIIGLDSKFLDEQFTKFVDNQTNLNATQIKFIQMLKNHIAKYGSLKLETLFEPPFTTVHTEGVYGVFPNEHQASQIINIVREINNYPYQADQPRAEE